MENLYNSEIKNKSKQFTENIIIIIIIPIGEVHVHKSRHHCHSLLVHVM
jgi:hypothetical protein